MLHDGHITQAAAMLQHATVQPLPIGHKKASNYPWMPKKEYIDQETRERIAGWVLHRMTEWNIPTQAALGRKLGIDRSTAGRILNATARSLGLDVFLKIHRVLRLDATLILNESPPKTKPPKGSVSSRTGQMSGHQGGRTP